MFYVFCASFLLLSVSLVLRMKKLNVILNKCRSFSRQMRRSSSYNSASPRSNSAREETFADMTEEEEHQETVYVGSKRRQYAVSSKHLKHPLLNALIEEKSKQGPGGVISVNCEVVLFDHLLWMLDNADPKLTSESLEELAELYSL
ncbi:hypothetical protein PVL29_013491 [Vitis rotundifolia]|uniref:Uncharacterized protein n=1 Tax=Vitis rotundifolia TaxID=103349 RepID=A0AA39DNM3_VITRO|nr:hypothetical protein PVL29_013491 [Vitis rotundifolia]